MSKNQYRYALDNCGSASIKCYSAGSNETVNWKCRYCSHVWPASIANRKKRDARSAQNEIEERLDKQMIREYNSLLEAEQKTGIERKSIRNVLQGKQNKAGGYYWNYYM